MSLPRVQTRSCDPRRPAAGQPALHVVTFGCQMNKYDSLLVEECFQNRGYRLTEDMAAADVILFNTCAVREHAEERVYSWLGELRALKQRRPGLVVGVLGCMAQRAEEEIFERAGHVDLLCGTRKIHRLPELVEELRQRRAAALRPGGSARLLELGTDEDVAVEREGRYRGGLAGYLTVMRGCDLSCTFCIVPRVRGPVRSRPVADLLREARWMIAGGARVITLLGQTVDAYGEDLAPMEAGECGESGPARSGRGGRPALADLLRALQELEGLERIRLVTLHPAYVSSALARAIADCDKVERFLPLPAQSGSDAVLKRMKRGYTTELYRERVARLKTEVPELELSSDWIVGFPGERPDDFERTLAFQREIGFVQNFVFQYSPRPGTRACELADDVSAGEKKARNQALLRAGEQVALERNRRHLLAERSVFVEEARGENLRGKSEHGLSVILSGPANLVGRTVRVRIDSASPFGLWGTRSDASE
jgi:tRNA-2-methylthio-N6-dimethylallyladenosine synthase